MPIVVHQGLGGRGDVEEDLTKIDRLDAVDQQLVRLREHCHSAALQALDEIDLPERASAVERAGDDPGREFQQLGHGARLRQGGSTHVEGEVEVGIVDPHRVGQIPGHTGDPLAIAGDERDPVGDQVDQRVIVQAAFAGLEDLDSGIVHGRRGRLARKEGQIAGS